MHLSTFLGSFLLISSFASAHFVLNYPISLGFDDDNEPEAPCGGFDVKFADNDTSVPVDSFPVALLSTHPAGNFTYRATLSEAAPFEWVELLAVAELGTGNFCLPNLRAPANWTGSSGLIQVIGDLIDGTLYQCAAVKFVSGSTASIDTNVCKNATVSATVTSTGNVTDSSNTTSSGSSTTSGSAPASSSSGAASSLVGSAFAAGLGAAFVGFGIL